MEDQLILCSYLSKKKLIPSRTASKSWLSISHFNDHKSLIHHDCQTFRSRYPFDLDTVYSQHYIKLDKIYYFFLSHRPHPRFVLKKRKENKKRKEKNLNANHSFCTMVGKYKENQDNSYFYITNTSMLYNWYQSIRVNPCVLHI